MQRPMHARRAVACAAALTTLIATIAVSHGQQPAAPPPPKPAVPVATNTVTANPDAYYGERVTLTAAVGQIFSRSAFSVNQRTVATANNRPNAAATDVLVLAPTLNGTVDLNAYVTVFGEVVRFD